MNRQKLKEAMDKRNMSMSDVAKVSGVAPAVMSRVMNGQRSCYVETAAKIRKGMKLTQRESIHIFLEE